MAKMMTSFAFSCLSHHRGVIRDAETPRFPFSQRSNGTPGPKSLARRPTHRSTPTRSQAGDLVGKYGGDRVGGNTQFPCSRRSHGTSGPKSPARRPTHRSTPHQAILPWGHLYHTAPLGLNQNARWKDPLLATPVTAPG